MASDVLWLLFETTVAIGGSAAIRRPSRFIGVCITLWTKLSILMAVATPLLCHCHAAIFVHGEFRSS